MAKKKDLFEERVYVHEVCLLGRPVYMNYTLLTSIYTERLYEFGLRTGGGYVAEIIFDIISSDGGDTWLPYECGTNETGRV